MESPCPDAVELRALVHDSLSEERLEALLRHVGECTICQKAMEEAAGTGSFQVERLRGSDLDDESDLACEKFIEQMKRTITQGEDSPKVMAPEEELQFLTPSEDENCLGSLGSLQVLEVVGRGGMGLVLRAIDPELERTVAVKVLAPSLAASRSARERFLREARAAAAIHHENVLPIHAVDRRGELPYFTMPLIEGNSLQERLDQNETPMASDQVVEIARKIASGLAAAHDEGLIHRDIKPANILLDESESRVWLADFGLARAMEGPSVTLAGTIVGTPQFMAPEQLDDEAPSKRTDLFSLGAVLYYMATGKPAFAAKSVASTIRRVIEAQPESPAKANPELPNWLSALIEKLLSKDPEKRPASAHEVVEIIDKHSRRSERGRSRLWLTVTIALIVIGYLVAVFWSPPATKPFQVASSGKAFLTLAEAVGAAQDGDSIEVATQDVRLTQSVDLGNKRITIQSAQESGRSVLDFSPITQDGNDHWPLLSTQADLTLLGLTLVRKSADQIGAEDPGDSPLMHVVGGRLQIQNCRFELTEVSQAGTLPATVVLEDAAHCEISDSILLHSNRGIWILLRNETAGSPDPLEISFQGNTAIGAIALLSLDHRAPRPLDLEMKNNVIAGRRVLAEVPGHEWADIRATVESNSFCFSSFRSTLFRVSDDAPFRQHVYWSGQDNTFATSAGVIEREIPILRVIDRVRPLIWTDQWDGWTEQISEKAHRLLRLDTPLTLPRNVLLSELDLGTLIPDEIVR